MKKGFLLDKNPKIITNKESNSSELGPLRDKRSVRVRFLWSGPAETVTSKPASWGWNSNDGIHAPGWKPLKESMEVDVSTTASTPAPAPTPAPPPPPNENPYKNVPLLPNKTVGVPKNALSSWYGKRHKGTTIKNEQFQTWNDGGLPHVLKWTSLFSCPITGEKFASGQYGDETLYKTSYEKVDGDAVMTNVVEATTNTDTVTKTDTETKEEDKATETVKVIETSSDEAITKTSTEANKTNEMTNKPKTNDSRIGVIWYSKKILAEHAAAARALDCLSLRESTLLYGNDEQALRLCKEVPYYSTDEIAWKQIGNKKTDEKKESSKKKRNLEQQLDFRAHYRNQRRYDHRYIPPPPPPPPPPPRYPLVPGENMNPSYMSYPQYMLYSQQSPQPHSVYSTPVGSHQLEYPRPYHGNAYSDADRYPNSPPSNRSWDGHQQGDPKHYPK